jgi:mycothione reductase
MDEYELVVVGAGSGQDVAATAANVGRSVAVVEKGPLGGTCLNRGCIPSKLLLTHADVLETVERADEFGIEATVDDVAFADIVEAVNAEVASDAEAIAHGVEHNESLHHYAGEGRFVDDRTLELQTGPEAGATVRGEQVLIAAGARPAVPPIDGIENVDYLTSREALELTTPPAHLVVVGGGYIGAELGHFFGSFGSDVTVVGRRAHLLPGVDDEVAHHFTEQFGADYDVRVGYEATAVGQSGETVTLEAEPYDPAGDAADGERVTIEGDALLLAAGRVPNTDTLDVAATDVETDAAGFVEVDDTLATTADGVWALGDIIGEPMLKHVANHEARTAMLNILTDERQPVNYEAMPYAVFSSPEVAGVGATEQELVASDEPFKTTTYRYDETAKGGALKVDGRVKVLSSPDDEILGCHIVGPQASVLVQEVVVAMTAGSGTLADIRQSVHIHPALSEVVGRAFSGEFVPGPKGGHEPHDLRALATEFEATED